MTKRQREKSIAIARDVLVTMRRLDISTGTYLDIDEERAVGIEKGCYGDYTKALPTGDMRKLLPILTRRKACTTCALGACFVSRVRLYDQFEFDGYLGSTQIKNHLRRDMGQKNVGLIESAFEQSYSFSDDANTREAVFFGYLYNDARARLRAIMRNIIKHNGEFRPQDDRRIQKKQGES